jgi:hypothetical protein
MTQDLFTIIKQEYKEIIKIRDDIYIPSIITIWYHQPQDDYTKLNQIRDYYYFNDYHILDKK